MDPLIRTIHHSVTTDCARLGIHLHYPALRDGQPLVAEVVNAAALSIAHFCLPAKKIATTYKKCSELSPADAHRELTKLDQEAVSLFKRVQEVTHRNGEAGELLLFILTEWILGAPQLVAKMSLKTNRDTPVYGSDGIHAKFDASTGRLLLFLGESKFHTRVSDALSAAVNSIKRALDPEKERFEIDLAVRHIDFSCLAPAESAALLKYLDPYEPEYQQRVNVITCLVGFDFSGYSDLHGKEEAQSEFEQTVAIELPRLTGEFSRLLIDNGLRAQALELFLFPLPSVSIMRDLFQSRVGWKR